MTAAVDLAAEHRKTPPGRIPDVKRTQAITIARELLDWFKYSGATPPAGSAEAVQTLIESTEKTRRGITAKMAGYAPKTRKRIASRAASSRWAGLTAEERSAEMSRRRRKGMGTSSAPKKVKQ